MRGEHSMPLKKVTGVNDDRRWLRHWHQPLHYARQGPVNIPRLFIKHRADIMRAEDWDGTTPLHRASEEGESTHPRNGVSSRSAYPQVLVSPRLQLGTGHVTSSQQPPMGRSYPPAFHQMVPSQVADVPYHPHHFNFSHLQNPSSQYQGSAFIQDGLGRPYYEQWYPNLPFLAAGSN